MEYMFDYNEWLKMVRDLADQYGVLYMVPEDEEDPVLVDAFNEEMPPDEFVYEHLLQEVRPDDEG